MLSILGFVFIIIATFYTYKSAKDNGRRAGLWALASFAVGFGIQIIVPILFAVIISLFMAVRGSQIPEIQQTIQTPTQIIGFVCLAASVVGVWVVLRKASQLRYDDEPLASSPPPPPPDFSAGE